MEQEEPLDGYMLLYKIGGNHFFVGHEMSIDDCIINNINAVKGTQLIRRGAWALFSTNQQSIMSTNISCRNREDDASITGNTRSLVGRSSSGSSGIVGDRCIVENSVTDVLHCTRRMRFCTGPGSDEYITLLVSEYSTTTDNVFTWPSALVLGAYLACHPEICKENVIVEIGCGTAVPSLVAALQGVAAF
jgi:hypothetical protein